MFLQTTLGVYTKHENVKKAKHNVNVVDTS